VEPEVAGPILEDERAPGEDQLTAELLNCGGPDLIRYLYRLINEIWGERRNAGRVKIWPNLPRLQERRQIKLFKLQRGHSA
jgi:hypothetical protein